MKTVGAKTEKLSSGMPCLFCCCSHSESFDWDKSISFSSMSVMERSMRCRIGLAFLSYNSFRHTTFLTMGGLANDPTCGLTAPQ